MLVVAEEIGYPLVAKPPAGAAAADTVRVEERSQLEAYLGLHPVAPGRPLLLEEFVVGEEHSFDAISVNGELVWHSLTHYRPGPLAVLENPWIQWTVLLPRLTRPSFWNHRRPRHRRRSAARIPTSVGARGARQQSSRDSSDAPDGRRR